MLLGIDGIATRCWRCKCEYALPMELYRAAKSSEAIEFYCPYGHKAHYPAGETEAEKLRRDRDRLQQRLAEKDDEIKSLENRRRAAVGQVTKMRNRVGHGVCPCCNRTFQNLSNHMASQHPDFAKEAAE